jgi:hypothetical protein
MRPLKAGASAGWKEGGYQAEPGGKRRALGEKNRALTIGRNQAQGVVSRAGAPPERRRASEWRDGRLGRRNAAFLKRCEDGGSAALRGAGGGMESYFTRRRSGRLTAQSSWGFFSLRSAM